MSESSLTPPLIYLITDGTATSQNFRKKSVQILLLVKQAVEANISLIQLREKQLPARLVFELAARAAEITRNSNTKLLINDRADIAFLAGADGVHLTEYSLSAETIRLSFPKNFIIGVSTHTLDQAENARRQKADFTTFSPIFQSPGKGEPQGLKKLSEICTTLEPFPVIALGGVDETNYQNVLEAGASGFAAIRFLNDSLNLMNLQTKK